MNSDPLTITFADERYLPLLSIWLGQVSRLGANRILVYALDDRTLAWCAEHGVEGRLITWRGDLKELWVKRIQALSVLLEEGHEVIHSDVDAIWVRNPFITGSARSCTEDLVFSQGTVWPPDVHQQWGFVLCCGWFTARPTPAARDFFSKLERDVQTSGDDQMSVNRLLAAAGAQWSHAGAADYQLRLRDRVMQCWRTPIRARFPATSLTVSLLPHAEFQRLPDSDERAIVKHYLTPKDCGQKLALLRQMGIIP